MKKFSGLLMAFAMMNAANLSRADDAVATPAPTPTPTKHQMMKDCMAKQKASNGGQPKEQMKKSCKDLTATEIDNVKTEKKEDAAEQPSVPAHQ